MLCFRSSSRSTKGDAMIHVAICVPSTGFWHSRTGVSVSSLCMERYEIGISMVALDKASIANSRNHIVQEVLDYGTATHILYVDSDMSFPSNSLMRLLLRDKDIIGVPYPMRSYPHEMIGKPTVITPDGKYDDVTEMEFLGCGLLLIKTDVFKAIKKPWFYETYFYPDREPDDQLRDMLRDQFPAMPDTALNDVLSLPSVKGWLAEGDPTHTHGEDVAFCYKAKRHGYKIWADMDLMMEVQHIGKKHNQIGKAEGEAE